LHSAYCDCMTGTRHRQHAGRPYNHGDPPTATCRALALQLQLRRSRRSGLFPAGHRTLLCVKEEPPEGPLAGYPCKRVSVSDQFSSSI
jgi:hypothetical protein